MGRIFDAVERYFEAKQWVVHPNPEIDAFVLSYKGESGTWQCVASARESFDQFVFYARSPVDCPDSLKSEMSTFIHGINRTIALGTLEFDVDEGAIRFRSGVDIRDLGVVQEMIHNTVYYNCVIFDRLLAGIHAIIHGARSAKEALHIVDHFGQD